MAFIFVAGAENKIIHDVALLKESDRLPTGYGLSTDDKPTGEIPNGMPIYLMDWKSLDSAAQAAAVSRVWMYDAQNGKWHPQ